MKKLLCMTLIAAGISVVATAQGDYKNSVGLRIAPETYYDLVAFSYKTFISDAGAIEFNAGGGSEHRTYYWNNSYHNRNPFGLSVSGSYQHHFDIPVQGLKWFVGGGLTAYNAFSGDSKYKGFGFGLYPTGGIDYKIPVIPLNVTADIRPTIFLANPDNDNDFKANFGISARYVIGRR